MNREQLISTQNISPTGHKFLCDGYVINLPLKKQNCIITKHIQCDGYVIKLI